MPEQNLSPAFIHPLSCMGKPQIWCQSNNKAAMSWNEEWALSWGLGSQPAVPPVLLQIGQQPVCVSAWLRAHAASRESAEPAKPVVSAESWLLLPVLLLPVLPLPVLLLPVLSLPVLHPSQCFLLPMLLPPNASSPSASSSLQHGQSQPCFQSVPGWVLVFEGHLGTHSLSFLLVSVVLLAGRAEQLSQPQQSQPCAKAEPVPTLFL